MTEDTSRIRLLFEDDEEILSPSQKSEGLKRCWFPLNPQQHKTFADVAAQVLHAFQLHHSCPHGLDLYMDGFTLPPFITTDILKNSDMISVRKKRTTLSLESSLEGQEVEGTQPAKTTLLLANKVFQEESGGYLSDELEDKEMADKYTREDQLAELEEGGNATSNKRKVSANLHNSQKKKDCPAFLDNVEGDAIAKQFQESSQDKVQSCQENIQKERTDLKNEKQAKNGKDKIDSSDVEISMDADSSDEIQNNANDALNGPMETKKISGSALCKKGMRKWLQELREVQKQKETVQNRPQVMKEVMTLTKACTSHQESYLSGGATKLKSELKNRNGKRDDGERKGLVPPRWIAWDPPSHGWIKCNTDASCFDFDEMGRGCTTIGGVFRDAYGRWIRGFMGVLGRNTIYIAELLAIKEAILIAKDYGIGKLWVESDSLKAVRSICIKCKNEEARAIIDDIEAMKIRFDVRLTYKQREANRVADQLARNAHHGEVGIQRIQEPPRNVLNLLAEDMRGCQLLSLV